MRGLKASLGIVFIVVGCRIADPGELDVSILDYRAVEEVSAEPDIELPDLCPSTPPISSPLPIIPTPFAVFEWGNNVAIETLSAHGADTTEMSEVVAIAQSKGLTVTNEGQLRIVFHSISEWDQLSQACGFDIRAETYYITVSNDSADVVASVFAADVAGRFRALKTLKQLIRPGGPPTIRIASILDHPAVPLRGVIEGFYGKPWTDESRLEMISLLGDLKFNVFAYAPKGDLAISVLWKVPLSEEDAMRIRAMAEATHRQRMLLCYEIRPVILLHFSSPEDFEALVAKFQAVAENGADCIIFAFDDTEKYFYYEDQLVYSSYIEGLVDFANRLGKAVRASLPSLLLVFAPHEYYLNAPDAMTDLAFLGHHLDPVWEIAWTGNDVVSKTVTGKDADAYAAIIHRRPFLADNFPVTDDANRTGILNLAPLTGRDPMLKNSISGLAFNASPLPFASLIGLATAADYAWNPIAYSSATSLSNTALWLAGEESKWTISILADTNQVPPFADSAAPELALAIGSYWLSPSPSTEATLRNFFNAFIAIPEAFDDRVLSPFALEVWPWVLETAAWGAAGGLALTLLSDLASGDTPNPDNIQWLTLQYDALLEYIPKPTGDVMPSFIAHALEVLEK